MTTARPLAAPTTVLPDTRVGCDVVDVAALGRRLERTPGLLRRVFTDAEIADAMRDVPLTSPVALRRLAARVAAKEAAYKAFAIPGLGFLDVEVRTDPVSGAPSLWLYGAPHVASVSLSHDGGVAMAVVAFTCHRCPTD